MVSRERLFYTLLVIVAALGIYTRVTPRFAGVLAMGFDESWYSGYVNVLQRDGLLAYPRVAQQFIDTEARLDQKIVPPLRLTYIYTAAIWQRMTGDDAFTSMKRASCVASLLLMGICFGFGARLGGRWAGLAMLALVGMAPMQVFMAHRALIDGYFSLWSTLAMWMTWECLQAPEKRALPMAAGVATALMVMTKETSAFVALALLVMLATAHWTRIGTPTWRLYAGILLGGLAGLGILSVALGGPTVLAEVLRIDLVKPLAPFTIRFADGPWYHYLLALFILDPVPMIFACAGLVALRDDPRDRFMTLFFVLTYLPMACIPYQAVVRLCTIWDFALAWLAWRMLGEWLRRDTLLAVGTAVLAGFEFERFYFFFQMCGVYEPVSAILLRCINIVK